MIQVGTGMQTLLVPDSVLAPFPRARLTLAPDRQFLLVESGRTKLTARRSQAGQATQH